MNVLKPFNSTDFDGMKYTQLSPLKYKTQKMIYYTKMMQVPNRSYTMKEQDLAPIAPKKRLVSTLGNKEISEKHYTQMNIHHKCNIHYDLTD